MKFDTLTLLVLLGGSADAHRQNTEVAVTFGGTATQGAIVNVIMTTTFADGAQGGGGESTHNLQPAGDPMNCQCGYIKLDVLATDNTGGHPDGYAGCQYVSEASDDSNANYWWDRVGGGGCTPGSDGIADLFDPDCDTTGPQGFVIGAGWTVGTKIGFRAQYFKATGGGNNDNPNTSPWSACVELEVVAPPPEEECPDLGEDVSMCQKAKSCATFKSKADKKACAECCVCEAKCTNDAATCSPQPVCYKDKKHRARCLNPSDIRCPYTDTSRRNLRGDIVPGWAINSFEEDELDKNELE